MKKNTILYYILSAAFILHVWFLAENVITALLMWIAIVLLFILKLLINQINEKQAKQDGQE